MNHALMSIKPKYVRMLLSRRKSVEIRRRPVRLAPGTKLWIYETSPSSAIVATAIVELVHCASPEEVWRLYADRVGIDRAGFEAYVHRRDVIAAIVLRDLHRLRRPLGLRNAECSFRPPQSYAYLQLGAPLLETLQGRQPTPPERRGTHPRPLHHSG